IDHDMRALEHEHRLAARERETLEAQEARMRQRDEALRQREDTYRKRLSEELEAQVRQARREIADGIAELKTRTDTMAQEPARKPGWTGETGAARVDARAAVDSAVKKALQDEHEPRPAAAAPQTNGTAPSVGDRVIVGGLGLEAIVTGVHDGTAELDVRGKR